MSKHSPETLIAHLESVPGLDVETGLIYLQGKSDAYLRILTKFAEKHQQDTHKIKGLLEVGQIGTAERMAHSLKGVAATLGAKSIQAKATALNQSLKTGQASPELGALLADLTTELEAFCTRVLSLSESVSTEGQSAQNVDFYKLAQQLIPLLAEGNIQASQLFEQNKTLLSQVLGGDFESLQEAVSCFDYETAHKLLVQVSPPSGL